jgi:hypothetical protein
MLPAGNGKFLIYASGFRKQNERLKIVGSAVAKVAENLHFNIEILSKRQSLSIYVYYKNGGDGEEIPVYCDWGKNWKEEDIYHAVKSVMFTLSFHPKYSILQTMRRQLFS